MDRLLRMRCFWLGMVLMLAGSGMAQTWAASSGAVDPASLTSYWINNGAVVLRPSLKTGTVTVRYNVLPVGDLAVPITQPCCQGRALWVRFLDNGNDSRVQVALKRSNVLTGQITTLLTFDSDQYPPQATFQSATPNSELGAFFNFSFASGPF